MQSWAQQELEYVQLNDARLNKRLMKVVGDFAASPESSVPQACGTWAATKAAYNFWNNPEAEPEAIRQAHQRKTAERLEELKANGDDKVLLIQDTTSLDFTSHPGTRGMGYLDHPTLKGLKVHSSMAVSTEGVPQGIVYQEVWSRDPGALGKKHKRRQLETKEKESQRWLNAQRASQEAVPAGMNTITIGDREADIYDLFAMPGREGSELLVRAVQNRRVDHEARYLWGAIRQESVSGTILVEIGRKANQPSREAILNIRYAKLSIQPPGNRKDYATLKPVVVYVVLAEEENPPVGETPVCWLLIATYVVDSFEEAVRSIEYYSRRTLIERYHYVLKSGCGIEELQLETSERLHRALATYSIVAWQLLWMTYEARENPEASCDRILETYEWESLYCTTYNVESPPRTPPSMHEAVRMIAKLGGFLGRRHDGEPGVKTIWLGLRRLHDIAEIWKLVHEHKSAPSKALRTYG